MAGLGRKRTLNSAVFTIPECPVLVKADVQLTWGRRAAFDSKRTSRTGRLSLDMSWTDRVEDSTDELVHEALRAAGAWPQSHDYQIGGRDYDRALPHIA